MSLKWLLGRQSLFWTWNLNKLFTVMGGKFKFQVQDSDFGFFFWRFDKQITPSEKKLPLVNIFFCLWPLCLSLSVLFHAVITAPLWPSGLRQHYLAEQFLKVPVMVWSLLLLKFIIYRYSENFKVDEQN